MVGPGFGFCKSHVHKCGRHVPSQPGAAGWFGIIFQILMHGVDLSNRVCFSVGWLLVVRFGWLMVATSLLPPIVVVGHPHASRWLSCWSSLLCGGGWIPFILEQQDSFICPAGCCGRHVGSSWFGWFTWWSSGGHQAPHAILGIRPSSNCAGGSHGMQVQHICHPSCGRCCGSGWSTCLFVLVQGHHPCGPCVMSGAGCVVMCGVVEGVAGVSSRVCVCVPVKPTRGYYVTTRGCATTT